MRIHPQSRQQRSVNRLRCMVGHSSGHGYTAAPPVLLRILSATMKSARGCVNVHKLHLHGNFRPEPCNLTITTLLPLLPSHFAASERSTQMRGASADKLIIYFRIETKE